MTIIVLDVSGWVFIAAGWVLYVLRMLRRADEWWSDALFLASAIAWDLKAILHHNVANSMIMTVLAVWWSFALWRDWKRRKRRGRLAAMGAKSRARIAAMTARMRERPARPVLRTVPQGAR